MKRNSRDRLQCITGAMDNICLLSSLSCRWTNCAICADVLNFLCHISYRHSTASQTRPFHVGRIIFHTFQYSNLLSQEKLVKTYSLASLVTRAIQCVDAVNNCSPTAKSRLENILQVIYNVICIFYAPYKSLYKVQLFLKFFTCQWEPSLHRATHNLCNAGDGESR